MLMKKNPKAVPLALVLISEATMAYAKEYPAEGVTIKGVVPCGTWVEYSEQPESLGHLFAKRWVMGFISGISTGQKINLFGAIGDDASLMLWITKYCKAHPLEDLSDAALSIIDELESSRQRRKARQKR